VKLLDRVLNPREIRRRLGMNQEQFWTQIGVTQSGGSRYESGRDMPRPVIYLKESHPDLYRTLRRAVKSRHKATADTGIALASELGEDVSSDILEPEEIGVGSEEKRSA
jgi:transcriptional regulator with XRE-family HTH domain